MRRNIVHEVTRKYMKLNKRRTLTSVIGITFMVMLMVCVFCGKDTAVVYLEDLSAEYLGRWEYEVYDLTSEKISELKAEDFTDAVSESVFLGSAELSCSENIQRPYVNLKVYEKLGFEMMNIRLRSGRLPENSSEIVISGAACDDGAEISPGTELSLKMFNRTLTSLNDEGVHSFFPFSGGSILSINGGETIELEEDSPYFCNYDKFKENKEYNGRSGIYTVVGIIDVPFFEKADSAGYTAITLWDDYFDPEDLKINASFTIKNGDVKSGYDLHSILCELAGEENYNSNDMYLAFSGRSADSLSIMVNGLAVFFYLIITITSVILISNMYSLSYRERCRYLSMLSSVGATAGQKRSSVYYESAVLIVLSLPAGIAAGLVSVYGGMQLLRPLFNNMLDSLSSISVTAPRVKLTVNAASVLLAVILSIFTVLISSVWPAFKVSRKGAVEGIRGNDEVYKYKCRRRRRKIRNAEKLIAGSYNQRQKRKKNAVRISTAVFIIIYLVTSTIADDVMMIIHNRIGENDMSPWNIVMNEKEGTLHYYSYGEERQLQYEKEVFDNTVEYMKRSPETEYCEEIYDSSPYARVSSDFLSSEYINAFTDIFNQYAVYDTDPDQKLEMALELNYITIIIPEDHVLDEIADRVGINKKLLHNETVPYAVSVNKRILSTEEIGFSSRAKNFRYYDLEKISDLKSGDMFDIFLLHDSCKTGLAGYADEKALKGFFEVSGYGNFVFLMSRSSAEKLCAALKTDFNEMFDGKTVKFKYRSSDSEFESLLSKFHRINFDNKIEYECISYISKDDMDNYYERAETFSGAVSKIIRILLIGFILLVSVICLMNFVNTAEGRMFERKRDIAVMISAGMTDKQIRKMLVYESLGNLIPALVAAVAVSGLLIYETRSWLSSEFGRILFAAPYINTAAIIIFTSLFFILIMFNAFRKVKKYDIMDCLVNENV